MRKSSPEDTIVALATPAGEGGIAIVRMSGPDALKIADGIFISKDGKKPSKFETYTIHYGHVIDTKKSIVHSPLSIENIVDEALLTVMRAPKSYTREDVVEINCHGGIQAAKKVLDIIVSRGSRIAEPGEFTKRAFLNGRIDLTQAEAVLDVIRAKTESSLKAAINQLDGKLFKDVSDILNRLIDIASHIEASIDFPDEELDIIKEEGLKVRVDKVSCDIKRLIDTFSDGIVLREGVLAVICGKPNVGKSSLMNLLLKRDRVIVAPIPGTTRDAVEETINLKGVPIRLVDTAGIGEVNDVLYKESSDRSKGYIERSDIILLMLDASSPVTEEDISLIRMVEGRKKITIINKIDIDSGTDIKKRLVPDQVVVEISVETKKNIDILEKAILDMVWSGKFTQSEGSIITNARHKELLDKAFANMLSVSKAIESSSHAELIAVDLKEAIFNLGLIIGKSVSEDVLDRIFENFCIGK